MGNRLRRRLLGVACTTALAGVALGVATPASADPILPVSWSVNGSIHLKKLNNDVPLVGGTFTGSADLGAGTVSGHLSAPPTTAPVSISGFKLATATIAMEEVGTTTGTLRLSDLYTATTSHVNIKITRLTAIGIPFNLVGPNCHTATPATFALSGTANLFSPFTMSGTFTMPRFTSCGLLTPALNLLLAGPGNAINLTFGAPTS